MKKLTQTEKDAAMARVMLEVWDTVQKTKGDVVTTQDKLIRIVNAIQSLPGEVLESISAEIKRRKS
jgi:hypothetical protein